MSKIQRSTARSEFVASRKGRGEIPQSLNVDLDWRDDVNALKESAWVRVAGLVKRSGYEIHKKTS
jgi:hypothetical protein